MGCITSSTSGDDSKGKGGMRKPKINASEGRKQQGVHELKQNYHIDSKTKVLGTGAFGRVF